MPAPAEAAPAAPPPLLRLQGIGKTFPNGVVALKGFDIDVGEGDFVSLLGPSGCGKSTALRLIAGLAEPSEGRVEWPGGVVQASQDARSDIGFVFQEPTLMPWASVADNAWLPLRFKGISRRAARGRVEEALALVGLMPFAGAYPRELSGGMKMRVSIARALVTRPRLLLMDEPFAALDEITRHKLNDDLLRLKAELATTIIFVTHSVYESVFLSTRIVVMGPRPGRVVDEFAVEAPLPREEGFRRSPLYIERAAATSAALRTAMSAHDEAQ